MIALVTYQRCRFRGLRWTRLVQRCDTRLAISRPSTEASTVLATTSKIQAGVVRWPRTPEFSSPNILMVRIFLTMWLSIEKEKKKRNRRTCLSYFVIYSPHFVRWKVARISYDRDRRYVRIVTSTLFKSSVFRLALTISVISARRVLFSCL